MRFFHSIFNLFYPVLCLTCGNHLVKNEYLLCSSCRHKLPETDFCNTPNNLIESTLQGRIPIVAGTALLYFRKKGIVQSLIHSLKYKNRQEVGIFFAKWMGNQLKESERFKNIQGIVMVPLHPKRYKQRGYNQLTVFAEELSKELEIPVYKNVLIKVGKFSTQTKKNRFRRFEKINERFHITDSDRLNGKHVLLIDDVFTTGATLEACASELLKTAKLQISIATMVVSDY